VYEIISHAIEKDVAEHEGVKIAKK
jgi:hypothetical protein